MSLIEQHHLSQFYNRLVKLKFIQQIRYKVNVVQDFIMQLLETST